MGGKPSAPAVDPKVAEDGVRATLTKAYESSLAIQQCKDAAKVQDWIDEYYTSSAIFIRPSGNPMGLDMLKGMWVSDDVVSKASELKAIESVNIFCSGRAATVVYETHEEFEYKGTPNDDNVKYSAVFELVGDKWKINHVHRCSSEAQ